MKFLVQIHSFVDVITNSSTELFSVNGDKNAIKAFIYEFLLTHELQYSGQAGEIDVKTLREEIEEYVVDADKDWYCFQECGAEYVYKTLETHEEKFDFILNDYCSCFDARQFTDIDKVTLVNIDWANRDLIEAIRDNFPGYTSLN